MWWYMESCWKITDWSCCHQFHILLFFQLPILLINSSLRVQANHQVLGSGGIMSHGPPMNFPLWGEGSLPSGNGLLITRRFLLGEALHTGVGDTAYPPQFHHYQLIDLGQDVKPLKPHFLYLWNGTNNISYHIGSLWGLDGILHIKHLAW